MRLRSRKERLRSQRRRSHSPFLSPRAEEAADRIDRAEHHPVASTRRKQILSLPKPSIPALRSITRAMACFSAMAGRRIQRPLGQDVRFETDEIERDRYGGVTPQPSNGWAFRIHTPGFRFVDVDLRCNGLTDPMVISGFASTPACAYSPSRTLTLSITPPIDALTTVLSRSALAPASAALAWSSLASASRRCLIGLRSVGARSQEQPSRRGWNGSIQECSK
jgi:hypothetical protein